MIFRRFSVNLHRKSKQYYLHYRVLHFLQELQK